MDLIEIGKHIRERRKELGLDQSTLATLAGIGINALVRLERGSGISKEFILHSARITFLHLSKEYIGE